MSTARVASIALVDGAGGVEGSRVASVDATSGSGSPNRSRAGGAGFAGSVAAGSECACSEPLALSHST
jgi:hypothetical protein